MSLSVIVQNVQFKGTLGNNASQNMEFMSLDLFPFIARILSVKSQQVTQFISFIYLAAITKLKPKSLSIEPISVERFEELTVGNSYKYDFFGDIQSCALLSINTLVALSASNKSWLKITKLNSKPTGKEGKLPKEKGGGWKIAMPPVEMQDTSTSKDYFIQCLCVSNAPKDFVLYVTNVKLFNIVNYWNSDEAFCDLVNQVKVECDVEHGFPCMAKSAVLSGVLTGGDATRKIFEDALDVYFRTPKTVKVGEVIHVNLLKSGDHLRSRAAFCNISDVYFKVITLRGQSDMAEQCILKGYTDIYLNPPVHSYLPPKTCYYIRPQKDIPGFEIPMCPDGLFDYFHKLRKIFKFLIRGGNVHGMLLLSGAKGSGKKTTLKAVSAFFGLTYLEVNCFDFFGINPSLVQGKLDQICTKARVSVPCVIHLENVELLGREQNYHENARLVDVFETHIKELWIRKPECYPLLVVGSTQSTMSEMVPAVARLFIHNISFDTPKPDEAFSTLKWLFKSSNMICFSHDVRKVVEKIRGYIFADLVLLTQHAIHIQSQDSDLDDESRRILHFSHFKKAIELMEAAYSDSIGAARVPTVHWEDVGGLVDLKEEIMLTLNLPIQHPELFTSGLKRSGILFYGPPGTGKTLMAKAVATECNYNFLSIKGPELMNMYVGQSEKNVREVFERAREASPCILFFDELDSLAPSRGKSGDSGGVTDRVVSQLLAEMDGLDKNKDVFVIAATNRPDLIDQALLRPGRFDKMFYVGVCKDSESKLSVLKALTRRFNLGSDVDFEKIVQALPNQVTGADLYSVCSNAWFAAARKAIYAIEEGGELSLPLQVSSDDFSEAVSQFVPSLTSQDIDYYENLQSSDGVM